MAKFLRGTRVLAGALGMSSLSKKLKHINQKDKHLASGYIRRVYSNAIPDEIVQICLLFYVIFEKWDGNYKDNGMEIMNPSHTICKCKYDKYQSIIGTVTAKRTQQSGLIHRWKLKLLKWSKGYENWHSVIGILNAENPDWNNKCTGIAPCNTSVNYFFVGWLQSLKSPRVPKLSNNSLTDYVGYGEAVNNDNDIVEMILDLKKGTLGYVINGTDYGIARDDVDVNGEYKMFITINGNGTSFEIVSYQNE